MTTSKVPSLKFPDGFLWGAATAAHQVEGGNFNTDCWTLEVTKPSLFLEPSGDAVDQWNRFADDMAVLSAVGMKSYRFSVEWARIEPEQGKFSVAALDHYQRCINACLERGIEPVITMHHFTLPLWVVRGGGFGAPSFPDLFARYCEKVARSLRGISVVCTINELNVPLLVRELIESRLMGPASAARIELAEKALGAPLKTSFLFSPAEALIDNGLSAHAKARDAIKSVLPQAKVGVTLAIQDEQAEPGAEHIRDKRVADYITPFLNGVRGDDFIGVQTYTRAVARKDGSAGPTPGHRITVMGYEDRPQALAQVCRYVWEQTKTPIVVTENGWAGNDDRRRCEFIRDSLTELHAAINDGVDVRGFFYWSLLDNFEWLVGYAPKFGLIAVDRSTQRRSLKQSALVYGQIARDNAIQGAAAAALSDAASETQGRLGGGALGIG